MYVYRPLKSGSHPADAQERCPEVLATWLRHFPESVAEDRDFEDWTENAVILHAADRAGIDLVKLLDERGGIHVTTAGWERPQQRPGAPRGMMLGMWTHRDFVQGLPVDIDPIGSDARSTDVASAYGKSPVFLRHAGRAIAMTGADVEGDGGIEAGLRQVVDACGNGRLFIKSVKKEFATRVTVDPGKPLWPQLADQVDGIEWLPVQHEGVKDGVLLVQERIQCRAEYRIFVIDGRPVTGSGCIEHFTPINNLETFDPQVEWQRNDGEVVQMPDLRDRYLEFARRFCDEFAAEHGEGLDYSLDLCTDEDGIIRVIELNPPLNLGRYACDMDAWMKAIVARMERIAA